MNKEDYVSFECAKLLKEMHLEVRRCDYIYALKPFTFRLTWWHSGIQDAKAEVGELYRWRSFDPVAVQDLTYDDYIEAPMLYHVQKLLRARKMNIDVTFSNDSKQWNYLVVNMTKGGYYVMVHHFPAYESALQAGIMKALELIKRKEEL